MKIPIVVIIFNRPDKTKKLYESLSIYKPDALFIISDGPRKNFENDEERIRQSREIFKHIDWDCEVLFNESETNLGCRERIISGLNWVFNKVEKAIILEDDCIPSKDFFSFMEKMLIRYQSNLKIASVCGSNLLCNWDKTKESYFYSKYFNGWGWGTWSARWQKFDTKLDSLVKIKKNQFLKSYLGSYRAHLYWHWILNRVKNRKLDAWDYIWIFENFINEKLHVTPKMNLISNIGIGLDSSNTKTYPVTYIPSNKIKNKLSFPLTHPINIMPNVDYDLEVENRFFSKSAYNRFLWFFKSLISLKKIF